MGFIPIFLTLGGFVLLFIMVVNQTLKTKKEQVHLAYQALIKLLDKVPPRGNSSSPEDYSWLDLPQNTGLPEDKKELYKKRLAITKLKRHQYNQLIQTKPYSFIAKMMGYSSI